MRDGLKPIKREDDHDDRYDAHINGDMTRKQQSFTRGANPQPSELTALGITLLSCAYCSGLGGATGTNYWQCRACRGIGENTTPEAMLAAVMSKASGKTTKELLAEALQVYKASR